MKTNPQSKEIVMLNEFNGVTAGNGKKRKRPPKK